MLSPTELYHGVSLWLHCLGISSHASSRAALGHLVTALLLGQSLRPAALMRALLSPTPISARQRFKRVARAWTRPWLSPQWLTPPLVSGILALVSADAKGSPTAGVTHLALDSLRCGRWEIFTLGVVWHGRVLPVGWAVLPYPWPKGRFTPTVCALVRQVAAAWPACRPAHVVADRAFPSRALFQTLCAVGWGWTLRLRATSWMSVDGRAQGVRSLLLGAQAGCWTAREGRYGSGLRAVMGTVVVGRGLVVLPWHQRGPASLGHRAAQHAQRQRHLLTKHARQRSDASLQTDRWVALFSSHPSWRMAVCSYRRRWATEGSYRDAQTGWDGQHGWDLQAAVARLGTSVQVERVVGLWALGALIQTWIGHQAGGRGAPTQVQALVRQWTTTGRLSVWGRGRLALAEPDGQMGHWLPQALAAGAERLATGRFPPGHACRTQAQATSKKVA